MWQQLWMTMSVSFAACVLEETHLFVCFVMVEQWEDEKVNANWKGCSHMYWWPLATEVQRWLLNWKHSIKLKFHFPYVCMMYDEESSFFSNYTFTGVLLWKTAKERLKIRTGTVPVGSMLTFPSCLRYIWKAVWKQYYYDVIVDLSDFTKNNCISPECHTVKFIIQQNLIQ